MVRELVSCHLEREEISTRRCSWVVQVIALGIRNTERDRVNKRAIRRPRHVFDHRIEHCHAWREGVRTAVGCGGGRGRPGGELMRARAEREEGVRWVRGAAGWERGTCTDTVPLAETENGFDAVAKKMCNGTTQHRWPKR